MQKDNKIGILLLTNENYVFACGAFLCNIIEKMPNFAEAIVMHDGISEESAQSLGSLDPRIKLTKYIRADILNDFPFLTNDLLNTTYFRRFSILTSIKFIAFKLLNNYDKLVFMDTDMLLLDDMKVILENNSYNVAWKQDTANIQTKLYYSGWKGDANIIKDYGHYTTPNGGFFIVNNNFDYIEAYNKAVYFFERSCKYHPGSIIEPILGYVCNNLGLKVLNVDPNIYNVIPHYFNPDSKLLHFLLNFKPWSHEATQHAYPQWLEYYKKFTTHAGKEFSQVKIFPEKGRRIFGSACSDIWSNFLASVSIPETFTPPVKLDTAAIRIYCDPCVYFRFSLDWGMGAITVELHFDKRLVEARPQIEDLAGRLLAKPLRLEAFTGGEGFVLKSAMMPTGQCIRQMPIFFERAQELLGEIKGLSVLQTACPGCLKTFFDKYLALKDGVITQESAPGSQFELTALKFQNLLAFRAPSGKYVARISKLGQAALADRPCFYPLKTNGDHVQINIHDLYLSARDDAEGSVHLVSQCRNWESFTFEQLANSEDLEASVPYLEDTQDWRLGNVSRWPEINALARASASPDEFAKLLRESGLFNEHRYLEMNKDVARAGMDAAAHYANFGWFEGRDPCQDRRNAHASKV